MMLATGQSSRPLFSLPSVQTVGCEDGEPKRASGCEDGRAGTPASRASRSSASQNHASRTAEPRSPASRRPPQRPSALASTAHTTVTSITSRRIFMAARPSRPLLALGCGGGSRGGARSLVAADHLSEVLFLDEALITHRLEDLTPAGAALLLGRGLIEGPRLC